jgi:hypothetical protein
MTSPAERALGDLLRGSSRRLTLIALIEGVSVGLATAFVLALIGFPGRGSAFTPLLAGVAAATVGATARAWLARRPRGAVAARVERATRESHNLIFTANELVTAGSSTGVASIVVARAGELAGRLDPAALFPVGRRWALLAAAAALWAVTLFVTTEGTIIGPAASSVAGLSRIEVTLTPPAYARRDVSRQLDPDRVTVLAGTRVEVRARTTASAIVFTTLDSSVAAPATNGEASASFIARADGLITLQAQGVDARRLIGITVVPDAPPTVRIAAPGKDLLVPDGKRTLDVAITAGDDIGLTSLTLRYTKVSGSGERFTFKDADVPIDIARRDARAWTAAKRWAIESLALEQGDMLVYRAIATDARPGALPVESDAFIVEIVAPGALAEAGYSVDPDEERTAISQQMVVLKTQRLIARKASLVADSVLQQSQEIAAEQRRVRAEFVFLMGGEMSDAGANDTSMTDIDETADAAAEEDLAAGRQLNQGRIALLRAIRSMSLAARSLNEADLTEALTHEREAVKQLELAFSRNRILLRAFSQREALDTTRRLTGDMSDLARAPRAALPVDSSARTSALRRLSGEVAIAQSAKMTANDRARFAGAMAEGVLRVDPSSRDLQAVSRAFTEAGNAWRAGNEPAAQRAYDRATIALNSALAGTLPSLDAPQRPLESQVLRGALIDLLQARRP